jgi:hypothetical protein
VRFVDGRPLRSSVTARFVERRFEKFEAEGKKEVLHLIRDDAGWHISKEVRRWLGKHALRIPQIGSTTVLCRMATFLC